MRRNFYLLLAAILSVNVAVAQQKENFVKDQLIINFKKDAKVDFEQCIENQKFDHAVLDELNELNAVKRIERTGNRKTKDSYLLFFSKDQDIKNLVETYMKTDLFNYVEPNYIGRAGGQKGMQILPSDTHFSRQYGLVNDGTFPLSVATPDADIDMDLGWDIEQGDPSIIVATLDAGLKLDHPEFTGRLWANPGETVNGSDDDQNGYIDDIQGWDFANNDNNPIDDYGHGTNVTGIIAANGNNNLGYAGVDWYCKLLTCKILDQNNSGLYSWFSDAVYYAVDQGADVINMSVGGSGFSSLLKTAVDYAANNGVTVVACMMNENNNVTYYPAGYANTIAVGSTNSDDDRSAPFFWNTTSGSNFGSHIDVVAPGNYIYGLSYNSNTNYNTYWGGTSQATPLVTGICALLKAQDPTRTLSELRTILRSTAEDQVGNSLEDVAGFDNYFGYGRVNAHAALLLGSIGVEEAFEKSNLKLYPNPTDGIVYVELTNFQGTIMVNDMWGKQVYQSVYTNEKMSIDVSTWAKGVYILQILDEKNNRSAKEKIVVQ